MERLRSKDCSEVLPFWMVDPTGDEEHHSR
jgi:hypothetical protein